MSDRASHSSNSTGQREPLPPAVEALIAKVASGTRLRRGERTEIAEELRSHFLDAVAAGNTASEAIAAFGDASLAAKHLRLAALQKRSPLDRALRVTRLAALWMALLFVAAYASFWLYLSGQGVTISFDPLQRMAALGPQATSSSDLAWPHLREAIVELKLGAVGTSGGMAAGVAHPASEAGWPNRSVPGAPPWDEQVAWCQANQSGLAMVRSASLRPVLGFSIATELADEDRSVFGDEAVEASQRNAAEADRLFRAAGVLLAHLPAMRGTAKALALDATVAASTGDGRRAVEDLGVVIRLSMLQQQPRLLINDLIAMAMRSLACSRALMLLEAYPDSFTDADLQALQVAMRSVPPDLATLDLSGESIFFEDFVQCTYTDDGDGDGWFNPDPAASATLSIITRGPDADTGSARDGLASLVSPFVAVSQVGRRQLLEQHAAWVSEMNEIAPRTLAQVRSMPSASLESRLHNDEAFAARHRLLFLLVPAISHSHAIFAADRAAREAVDTVAAALRFRLANGAWPSSAHQLVPSFLPTVPLDPWSATSTPVAMGDAEGAFRIWSIGCDQVDQGGVIAPADRQSVACETTQPNPRSRSNGDLPVDWVWYSAGGDVSRWFEQSP